MYIFITLLRIFYCVKVFSSTLGLLCAGTVPCYLQYRVHDRCRVFYQHLLREWFIVKILKEFYSKGALTLIFERLGRFGLPVWLSRTYHISEITWAERKKCLVSIKIGKALNPELGLTLAFQWLWSKVPSFSQVTSYFCVLLLITVWRVTWSKSSHSYLGFWGSWEEDLNLNLTGATF